MARLGFVPATGAPVMVALVSVPVLVLFWLLFGAFQRHEQQHADARDVVAIYRAGLQVLGPLDDMRSLSRAVHALNPVPDAGADYAAAVDTAQSRMDVFLARVGQRGEEEPSLESALGRMEQMPWLAEIVVDVEADTLGPFPGITRYADGLHRLLGTVLYGADLPDSGGAQATEMLLLVPDTLRRLRQELALLQLLTLPGDSAPGTQSSLDVAELDRSWNAVIEIADTLEGQLLDIEQREGLLPEGRDATRLADVRAWIDFVEQHFILGKGGPDWATVRAHGRGAQDAVAAIEEGLVDSAEARLQAAHAGQRRADLLMAGGLSLLYVAIVYFMVQYYRSRATAQRERELQVELEERRARERELMHLNQLSEDLMSCHGVGEACDAFSRSAAALFPGVRGALALVSPSVGRLLTVSTWGGPVPLAAGYAAEDCRAMRARMPLGFPGAADACTHYQDGQAPDYPHACVPMVVDGKPFGTLWLEGARDEAGGLQLAVSATEALKLALVNIRLRESLQEQAVRDVLTGLYNRRQLLDVFPREMAHACRTGQPLAVVVIDIDHFKRVNDTHGHDAGDQALVALARHMRDSLRASDFVFRLGGEEFVLLLRTDLAGGHKAVDTLRAGFGQKAFAFAGSEPVHLSFSAGVVEAPLFGQDLDQLLKLADEALYRAKEGGRDRVEVARRESAPGAAVPDAG